MTQSIYSVSDLHLFCRRSQADHYQPRIEAAIRDADHFVFNGDIFDFRWSVLPTSEETARAAVRWLQTLVERHPETRFHYVLGNHDHVRVFIDQLNELAERTPNLSWEPYYLKLGRALFLHGDCVVTRMTARDLEAFREGWLEEEARGEFVNRVYDWAFRTRIHLAVSRAFYPRAAVLSRLSHYLDDIGHGAGSGISEVYFGHTHLAIDGLEHRGQRFFNGGAPMPGLDFRVLRADFAA